MERIYFKDLNIFIGEEFISILSKNLEITENLIDFYSSILYVKKNICPPQMIFGIFLLNYNRASRKKLKIDFFKETELEDIASMLNYGNLEAYYENSEESFIFLGLELRFNIGELANLYKGPFFAGILEEIRAQKQRIFGDGK